VRGQVGQESVDCRSMSGNDRTAETDQQFSDICTSVLCHYRDTCQKNVLEEEDRLQRRLEGLGVGASSHKFAQIVRMSITFLLRGGGGEGRWG